MTGSMSGAENLKAQAHSLVDSLPEGATWDDLMRAIYVRRGIEAGRADARAGRVTSVDQLRSTFADG